MRHADRLDSEDEGKPELNTKILAPVIGYIIYHAGIYQSKNLKRRNSF